MIDKTDGGRKGGGKSGGRGGGRDGGRDGGAGNGEGGRKSFTPRSRGMFSHGGGGAKGDRPKSYGRVKAEPAGDRKPRELGKGASHGKQGGAEFGGRKERFSDRPRRFDDRPRDGEEGANRAERPLRAYGAAGEGAERRDGPRERSGKDFDRPRRSEDRGERRSRPDRGGEGQERRDERPRKPFGERDGGRQRSFGKSDERGERRPPRGAPRASEDKETSQPGEMRIAKRLARAGIASRRDAEGMIADGRVKVNGKVLESPALTVTARDRIEIDGSPLPAIERTRLWLFHKPAGLVTTNRDPEGRPTVFDRLPEDMPRVLSVGRLDINTEGLLLLTNDGGLARTLELPATGWLRRYRVRAHGSVKQEQLDELKNGIAIDGVFYGAVEAALEREQGTNVWLSVGLREGKNREVKRILGHLGLEVNRLIRVSFGPFQLADLEEGAVREIKGRTLRDQLGDRLIEESGADFDAPVVNAFSNKPVKSEERRETDEPKQKRRNDWISSSGEKAAERPNRKRFGEEKREKALERMDTRPRRSQERDDAGPGRPRFKDRRSDQDGGTDAGRAPRKPTGQGRRHANVWMAPGARPQGEGRKKPTEGGWSEGKPAPSARGGDRPRGAGKPGPKGPRRPTRDKE
ncbi:pseudouridine synthase [Consotaella salsifontis]|uniref:Pseudouridine synthase n=1 Tax=Consotaella salsifontis TaxID=1365950 RepID=A0A1T4PYJ6_9HYPH|nr:pseudouridine synthase [Consotaella salsifontis]SJZ96614.1 23S rRNA pseudouridine2605 synthase [Consotaella salsifontis]